jgi:hypothetical protein
MRTAPDHYERLYGDLGLHPQDADRVKALELADKLERVAPKPLGDKAAAELRRLHQTNDALIEALIDIGGFTGEGPMTTRWQSIVRVIGEKARAAIKQAEEQK